VSRLVFTSSTSVTFEGTDQCGVDESAPYPRRWLAHYPRTKARAEQRVLAANSPEQRTCSLRPHLVWGPRDHHLTARLVARARSGRLRRVGDGTNRVDMIYVENAAEAHLQAADALANVNSPAAGKAYFLSQGEPVGCWQWIDEVLALAGLAPVVKSLSLRAAWRLGLACEWAYWLARSKREPPMTRFLASQLATSHWFDIRAARRDFGYEARISTAEGMQRLGQWLATREPLA
jgi:nucleoside-diphosphate-sugar epimerase